MTDTNTNGVDGWAILELMGHRRLGGMLSEVSGGALAGFLRIDIPGRDGKATTQFYAPAAVYCITPTSEDVARKVANLSRPEPVTRWELERAARTVDEDDFG